MRAGDPDAFGSLFEEYAKAVYNHAFQLTGDWSTAEDVVALTFLEGWRLRETLDEDGGSLRPWLLGIATNVARNTRRAARRHAAAQVRLPPPEAVEDFAEDLAGRIDDRERLVAVQRSLAALRSSEREVVALCIWSGLDYAAAGQALGIPVGTVRSRLSRARKKLRRLTGTADGEIGNPPVRRGQVEGDRAPGAWPVQEGTR